MGGEARNPQRDLPRAVMGAVLIGTLIYLLLEVAFIGALDPANLAGGWANPVGEGDFGPYATIATTLTLVATGVLPVLFSSDALNDTLRADSRGGLETSGRRALRSALVASQVALALVLLVIAGLLSRSLFRLEGIDLGYVPDHLSVIQTSTHFHKYKTTRQFNDAFDDVARHIRAHDPRPGAWGRVRDTEVKLFGAHVEPRTTADVPGVVLEVDSKGLLVACGSGAVRVLAVQPAGKRRLAALEWAHGRGVAVGDRFDTSTATPA